MYDTYLEALALTDVSIHDVANVVLETEQCNAIFTAICLHSRTHLRRNIVDLKYKYSGGAWYTLSFHMIHHTF